MLGLERLGTLARYLVGFVRFRGPFLLVRTSPGPRRSRVRYLAPHVIEGIFREQIATTPPTATAEVRVPIYGLESACLDIRDPKRVSLFLTWTPEIGYSRAADQMLSRLREALGDSLEIRR